MNANDNGKHPTQSALPHLLASGAAGGMPPGDPPRGEAASDDGGQDRLILRTQAAKLIPCSVATLRRLEKTVLRPILVDEKGVHWHSLKQVQAYAASLKPAALAADTVDGAIAGAAFELFDANADAADVVKALKIPSAQARQLQAEWADLRGVMLISGTTLSKIRSFRTTDDNPILTGEELLVFLEQLDIPSCAVCRRTPTFCLICYHRRSRDAEEMVALAIRNAEEREADLRRRQVEKATYDQARERAAYDPRPAAAARAAEEARRAERGERRARAWAARQAAERAAATPDAGRSDADGATTFATASARDGHAGATPEAPQPMGAARARGNFVRSEAAELPESARVANSTRVASVTTAGRPSELQPSEAVNALPGALDQSPGGIESLPPIELNPNDPDFLEKLALAERRDLETLKRLLASSPLTDEDRRAFAREEELRKGKNGP